MRIAIVTETYPPEINGVAVTISHMLDVLRSRHSIQLVRPRQGPQVSAASGSNFEEALMRGLTIPGYDILKIGLPAKSRLTHLWSALRPDLVHVVTEGPLGWSAIGAAEALGIPCTSDFHTNFHNYSRHYGMAWLEKPVMAWLRSFHNRTRATFVPTAEICAELAAAGYRGLAVVGRGVDSGLFHPARRSEALRAQWGAQPGQLVVLSVGRLAREKALPHVVRTFRSMRAQRQDTRLVIVGDGPERKALEKIAGGDAWFAGMRTGEDLAAHYASADIFLFPSVSETYGNVTVEAMASGLAVVAYDYAAAALHIRHGENGLLAKMNDENIFTALASNLPRDPALIQSLRLHARVTAEGMDWKTVDYEFEDALMAVVHTHATGEDAGEYKKAGVAKSPGFISS